LEGVLLNKATNFAWITGGKDVHGPEIVENGVASFLITKKKLYILCINAEKK